VYRVAADAGEASSRPGKVAKGPKWRWPTTRGRFARVTSGRAFVIGALLLVVGCQGSEVSRSLGARCRTSSECEDRCLPPSNGYPDGFCTYDCFTSRGCPEEAVCADREDGVCLILCNFDEDCTYLGAGWTCKDTNTRDGSVQVQVCRGD
jgi:hypothetical protein